MMPTENEDKITVCKVLKYEKDVEPFPLVKIYSGVGSGKSYFATCMVTGSEEYHIPKQTVLIITSRRAKVEETLKELKEEIKEEITKNGNLSDFGLSMKGSVERLRKSDWFLYVFLI